MSFGQTEILCVCKFQHGCLFPTSVWAGEKKDTCHHAYHCGHLALLNSLEGGRMNPLKSVFQKAVTELAGAFTSKTAIPSKRKERL